MYECPRCNYETTQKHNLLKHFKRKSICENLNDYSSTIGESITLLNEGKFYIKNTETIYRCNSCNKKFDRQSRLENHKEKCKNKSSPLVRLDKIILQFDELKKIVSTKMSTPVPVPKSETEHHIYIIHEREFVNTGQPIYKIGKTTKSIKRLSQYPKDSKLKLLLAVENCHESEKLLIVKFDEMFVNKPEIGREYYEGELKEMIKLYLDCI
jgi:hypothetical protein